MFENMQPTIYFIIDIRVPKLLLFHQDKISQ